MFDILVVFVQLLVGSNYGEGLSLVGLIRMHFTFVFASGCILLIGGQFSDLCRVRLVGFFGTSFFLGNSMRKLSL